MPLKVLLWNPSRFRDLRHKSPVSLFGHAINLSLVKLWCFSLVAFLCIMHETYIQYEEHQVSSVVLGWVEKLLSKVFLSCWATTFLVLDYRVQDFIVSFSPFSLWPLVPLGCWLLPLKSGISEARKIARNSHHIIPWISSSPRKSVFFYSLFKFSYVGFISNAHKIKLYSGKIGKYIFIQFFWKKFKIEHFKYLISNIKLLFISLFKCFHRLPLSLQYVLNSQKSTFKYITTECIE